MPRLLQRKAPKNNRRLRVEGLEDRTVPSFTVAPSFSVGPGSGLNTKPVSVTSADFNGDGFLDVATANEDSQNLVSVLLGNGDGTFQPANTINLGRKPAFITSADLNADGFADLVTANTSDNSISVLLGIGDGTFQASNTIALSTGTGPMAIAVGDLDRDGKSDLAIADNGSSVVSVLLGDGSGQAFTESAVTVNTYPTSIALADFNGDNHLDIATVSGGSRGLNINLNNGNGTFAATTNFATGFCPNGVTTGDFNHDGKADVAVACVFPSSDGVSILIGNGDGTFVTHPNPPGGPIPYVSYNAGNQTPGYITTADINADGNADLVTANYSSTGQFANNSISILPGKPDGTFGPARVYHGGPAPMSVAIGDFNGDGHADVVTADSGGSVGTVSMLLGRGDGTMLAAEAVPVTVRNSSTDTGVALGDFTGDGKFDMAIVTWNVYYNGVTLFPGLGNGQFAAGIQSPAVSATTIASSDFNTDGKLDLVVTGSSGVSILLGNGNGTFGAPTTFAVGNLPSWVAVGDLNGDGKADLAVANGSGSDGASVLLGDGTGSFGAATSVPAGGSASFVTIADLNADGKADLAVVNSSTVSIVPGNGDGTFGTSAPLTAGTPDSVSVGDFNGDGLPDLTATSFIPPGGGGSAMLVWLNDGTGGFSFSAKYVTDAYGSNPIGSTVADFNQDGILDILAVNDFSDTVSLYTGVGDGTFNPQVSMVVGDRPTWVLPADFTGDGRLDMAIVNSNSGTVTVIDTPKPASHLHLDAVPAATAGNSFQVTVTAFDEDGQQVPDFTGSVTLGSSDVQADLPLPNPFTFTLSDQGTHTFDVTLKTAGPQDVTVTGPFGTLTATIQVASAAADHFEFDAPTAGTAGQPFDVTVRTIDTYGNHATDFTGTVQFTSTDPNAGAGKPVDYPFTIADAGSHTFTGGFTLLTAGSQTVSVTGAGLTAVDATLNVDPAAASRLTISAPPSTQAGNAIDVTVTAFDPYDNLATGFTGTIHFAHTDPIAGTIPDYQFTGSEQGTHTIQVTLKRAGDQNVSVSATGLTGDQVTGIHVTPGPVTKLAFVNGVANTFPNLPIPTPVAVEARDQFDNPAPSSAPVTLTLVPSVIKAKLKGVLFAFPDANGVVTFPKALITKPGSYTLSATIPGGLSVVSDPFTVYAATHLKVKLSTPVTTSTAGDTVSVTVTVLNAKNKPDTTYRGTVHLSSTDLKAVLLPDYTFTAGDNGQHTFDVVLKTAGHKLIAVNDVVKAKMKGRVPVTVVAGAATQFAVTKFPLSAKVNSAFTFVVTALDQFGNQAKGYLGTVTISSNGSATIGGAGAPVAAPATYAFTTHDKGKHTFKATFTAPGTGLSLTVTDQADGNITGTETGITVV
jgi:hypothetical protein